MKGCQCILLLFSCQFLYTLALECEIILELLPWTQLTGRLKYYSCGPYSCWGVNSQENVLLRRNVTSSSCGGSTFWDIVKGTLSMVEVATDGSVYGVDYQGSLLQRVSPSNPAGTEWQVIGICRFGHKHVTFDLGGCGSSVVMDPSEDVLECPSEEPNDQILSASFLCCLARVSQPRSWRHTNTALFTALVL